MQALEIFLRLNPYNLFVLWKNEIITEQEFVKKAKTCDILLFKYILIFLYDLKINCIIEPIILMQNYKELQQFLIMVSTKISHAFLNIQ